MVIGRGTMAQAFSGFTDNTNFLIFASGVSNSKETNQEAFDREMRVLQEALVQHSNLHLVYFCTCSVYDAEECRSLYVQHKLAAEQYIQKVAQSYTIFRVSNVVSSTLQHTTIFSYLAHHIQHHLPFKLWKNAYRNILGIEDIQKLVGYLLQQPQLSHNQIINIANPTSYAVIDIVKAMEIFFQHPAHYEMIDKGVRFEIDTSLVQSIAPQLNIAFDNQYIYRLLQTYYSISQ
ncbi:MAG: NAD-dependent epimerase/dehydratase family protein [Thermoflexibacteraceae bacterium]